MKLFLFLLHAESFYRPIAASREIIRRNLPFFIPFIPLMACCSCPVQPCPLRFAAWLPRIGFGLALAGYGVNHYRNLEMYVGMAGGAFPKIALLGMLAMYLAYVVPLLQIVGGVLFATKQLGCVSKFCILASLGGILGWAGLSVMLENPDMTLMGAAIQNAGMFLIIYYVIKMMSCGSCGMMGKSCMTGQAGACMVGKGDACGCGKGGACMCGMKK